MQATSESGRDFQDFVASAGKEFADMASLERRHPKGAQHAASASNSANGKAEGAARIKGARSQG
jgi:hypothetical protein